jgi:hypothetical protein
MPVGVIAGIYPYTPEVSRAECDQIEIPSKFMYVNLPTRRACKGRLEVNP